MRRLLVVALVLLSACAPRGQIAYAPDPTITARSIFVGSTRQGLTSGLLESSRTETLHLSRYDVSVPPDRTPGDITYTEANQPLDPQRQFLVARSQNYPEDSAFRADLRRELARNNNEAVVFVHGFNTTFAEGLYRLAQLGADFDLPGVLVHYSWPSRGHVMGYAYDRDSALFARDGFQELLAELRRAGARKILIVGHSMGAALSMETLRQIAISGDTETLSRLSGVVLISPDLDVDVFRAQAHKIGTLPQPFIIFTSQRDKALSLAARLSGEPARLGNLKDVERVADLRVTLVDVGAFNTREGHFNVGNSPALIALLGETGRVAAVLEGDQTGRIGLISGVVITVQNATQVILAPIGG
ncbi:MAG: alpha/beta fold hydrolase [Paracoccaceae bacterium]|jgi:esterase/lipase superfamily enzyme|nr:alpha/beta fold hydrolase [Paracoccaceae bacterium]